MDCALLLVTGVCGWLGAILSWALVNFIWEWGREKPFPWGMFFLFPFPFFVAAVIALVAFFVYR
jgi:hypothetical protein